MVWKPFDKLETIQREEAQDVADIRRTVAGFKDEVRNLVPTRPTVEVIVPEYREELSDRLADAIGSLANRECGILI